MQLLCTYYKTSGKYYGEDAWDITEEQVEELKKIHGYDFEGVKDYIILYSTYHNPKQFHWVVELVDQPDESGAFCQFLEFAKEED
jgi:hypothetical protein